MKIEHTLKREGGTRVSFDAWPNEQLPNAPRAPAAIYHFKPLDPSDPNSPHVADVTNEHHAARLLSIVEGYRFYNDGSETAGFAKPPAPPLTVAQLPAAPDLSQAQPKPAAAQEPDQRRVNDLRDLPVKDLKAKINTYSTAELRAALELEQKEKKPRATWIEVVEADLDGRTDDDSGADA